MYLWRKRAGASWLRAHQEPLRSRAGDRLVIIARPDRKRLQLEAASESRKELRELVSKFGGQIEKLPRDWLKQSFRQQKTKPLKVGKRLVIINVGGTLMSRRSRHRAPSHIVIPAGAAFGTGEHVTTAMSLRMLERLIRFPDLVVDLGTGSGILALAARRLGAKQAIGIDIDQIAIATAKQNARRNKIDNVQFRVADVRRWKFPGKSRLRRSGYGGHVDIVAANLFSDLLVEILPKLKHIPRLILSGIMRNEETEVIHALKQNKIDIMEVRRRGKWIAILAGELRRS